MSDKNPHERHNDREEVPLENVDGNLHYEGKPLIFDPAPGLGLVITFHTGEDREVGRMWCDPDGKMQFEGDLEESAEQLFTLVKQLWNRQ